MRLVSILVLVVSFAFATGCGGSGAPPAKTPASTAPSSGSIFFWHATQKGKPGSVWLLGSIHLRGDKPAPIDRAITDAATTCERGAFELDFDKVDQAELTEFVQREGMLHGKTLRDVVTPETYAAWSRAVDAHHLPRAMHEKLQPWMAAMLLQLGYMEQQGIRGEQGIDRLLFAYEKQEPTRKRTIRGLETALEQMRILQSALGPIQDLMLRATALGIEKKEVETMLGRYAAGDEAGTERLVGDRSSAPELAPFMEAVFDKRNVTMTAKIRPMFDEPGCTVVTVGVGHMLGPTGILHQLEAAGMSVTRVAARGPSSPAQMAYTVIAPKVFVSEEDGFEVRSASTPQRKVIDIAGASGRKMAMYSFSDRPTIAVTIYVADLGGDVPAAKRKEVLVSSVAGGLKEIKLVTGEPEEARLGGEPAIRMRGDRGSAEIASGESVAILRGSRLYLITMMRSPQGPIDVGQRQLEEIVTSFRLR
jgi:uncharacterized protein YbaP (TraB family)